MITVMGCGTGSPPARIEDADLVVGAARHLAEAELPRHAECVTLGPLGPALDRIAAHLESTARRPAAEPEPGGGPEELRGGPGGKAPAGRTPRRPGRVVVLASGDPGFFGIVRVLADRFGPHRLDVRPAAPSLAVAFARAGLPWDDAAVVSAHGRDLRTAVNVCRAHPKTAVLTGPGAGPAELGAALAAAGVPRTLVVATALGSAGEHVVRLSPAEAATRPWPPVTGTGTGTGTGAVNVVLCLDERPGRALAPAPRTLAGPGPYPRTRRPGDGWALPEADFEHRAGMVTKYEVRALALARLAPRPGDLVWDVGAGSGSVAVECARFGAAAVAVERRAEDVARILANAGAHGVDVQAVHGTAPAALAGLPDPDAVFVGGGGADAAAVVAACARRARRAVVVTLAAVDRVPGVRAALAAAGFGVDGVLLQSSRLAPLPGEVTRLAAANPVFVLWGVRDAEAEPGDAGTERQRRTAAGHPPSAHRPEAEPRGTGPPDARPRDRIPPPASPRATPPPAPAATPRSPSERTT
ncbi:bifunctional cobalt-precorrin-7 (C(5))-methyltransferase/cobalt-precorrin-6B (C(15))-methyltransferase [Streptomyces aculeolatus]